MRPPSSDRPLIRWAPALLFTLALHIGVGWGLRSLDLLRVTPPASAEPKPIEVVFKRPPQKPLSQFTELPPDRAETPPDQADLLSNVDSRARDREAGGSGRLAHQEGAVDIPQVAMDTGQASPLSTESAPALPNPETAPQDALDRSNSRPVPRESQQIPAEDPWAAFRRASTRPEGALSAESSPRAPATGGLSDIRQNAMAAQDENAEFPGDISLNTKAWDWAPWLLAFRRELMDAWTAPLGYHLGLIHGWTLLEVVIAPNGEVLSNRVLDEEGNIAFRESSLSAIERSKPYLPLPDDFPESTLILTIRLGYPEWQPQPSPQRRPAGRR